jgi:hypothetical protein
MRLSFKCLTVLIELFVLPYPAVAVEPVRHIGIYVERYYRAVETPDGKPQVAVGEPFDGLLASNRSEDVLEARDLILVHPQLITPMTMMVLAIRLYDLGFRDDAVFRFYVAKDRYVVMSEVLDVKSGLFVQAGDAVRSFSTLAGPVINGYAFCDLAKQAELHSNAVDWVEDNPYQVMLIERLPALPGNHSENLKRALANTRERAVKERAYFADSKEREAYDAMGKANQDDVKFCWK